MSLSSSEFSGKFLDRDAADPAAQAFRHSAMLVAGARDQSDLARASRALASGMVAVGLDRWPAELRQLAQRASSHASSGIQRYKLVLRVGPGSVREVAIDFDPRDLPISPEAGETGIKVNAIATAIVIAMQGTFEGETPQAISNHLHALFARKVRALNIPGVHVERSFRVSGDDADYGEKGSARVDVIFENPRTARIECICDWKVGGATLTARRARELSERASKVFGTASLPPYPIPVREFHVVLVPLPE